MANTNRVPLPNVSLSQINDILDKFNMTAPENYDCAGRVELLRCSTIYNRYLSEYETGNISAHFDENGKFTDFSTTDSRVSGIFSFNEITKGKQYPCTVCANEVTSQNDDTGYGLLCNGCDHYFHNSCNNKKVSPELFVALNDSPEYVKVYCPHCCFPIIVPTTIKGHST